MHTDIPTPAEIALLLEVRDPACVTLYLPTTPLSQEAARGDRIAFKNLVAEAARLLADRDVDRRAAAALVAGLDELEQDYDFWSRQARGLAVFASPGRVRYHRLPSRLTAAVTVEDRFAITPLLRAVTFPHAAYVLALSQGACRLLELTADGPPAPVAVPELPADQEAAVGRAHVGDPSQMTHLVGAEGDKVRMRQYARLVDGALRNVLAGRELPLILAAAEPLDTIFRAVCTYPHLAPEGIAGSPERRTDLELADAARPVLDAVYARELADLRERLDAWALRGRAATDLGDVARAATQGAIDTLLVDMDADVRGAVDPDTGAVDLGDGGERVTEEVVRRTLATGGHVLALRDADVPGPGPAAALLRHALV